MTAQEWLACSDPEAMLDVLRPLDDKSWRRLFCAACCRRIWHLLKEKISRDGVELIEQEAFVHGSGSHRHACYNASRLPEVASQLWALRTGSHGDWEYAQSASPVAATAAALAAGLHAGDTADTAASAEAIEAALATVARKGTRGSAVDQAGQAAWEAAWQEPSAATWNERWRAGYLAAYRAAKKAVKAEQAAILRDIFPEVVQKRRVERSWLQWKGGMVEILARSIQEQRAFHLLPILADALEEAGCADLDLLGHLRGPGPHVLGCWGLDAILLRS